jgi:hypothetical protein
MRMWQVVLLMNLTLAVGLGIGYGVWGRRMAEVSAETKTTQAQVQQLTREREACFAGAAPASNYGRGAAWCARSIPGLL